MFPPGFTCPAVLWIQSQDFRFRLRASHPLWRTFPRPSANFHSRPTVLTPKIRRPSVWPPPRSLATTCGISVDVFSCPYLDVSVQGVPRVRLFDSPHADTVLPCRVSPFGDLRINAYVPLPGAYRSLSRPSSAPDAKAFPLRSYQLDQRQKKLRSAPSVALAPGIRPLRSFFLADPNPLSLGFRSGKWFSIFWFSIMNYAGHRRISLSLEL